MNFDAKIMLTNHRAAAKNFKVRRKRMSKNELRKNNTKTY